MHERRTALLVDGDNLTPRHAGRILEMAAARGRLDVARVYAAAHRPTDWLTAPGFRFVHAGAGKNAADVLLCIDAMELALRDGIEGFVLATSDRDFAHLAQRLREYGRPVLGLGEEKAPEEFRRACTDFALLEPGAATVPPEASRPKVTEFDRRIRCMIARHSTNGQGMLLAQLPPRMHAAHGTRISSYPERNWRAYLVARPELYDVDPRGPEALVRFKPAGFAGA